MYTQNIDIMCTGIHLIIMSKGEPKLVLMKNLFNYIDIYCFKLIANLSPTWLRSSKGRLIIPNWLKIHRKINIFLTGQELNQLFLKSISSRGSDRGKFNSSAFQASLEFYWLGTKLSKKIFEVYKIKVPFPKPTA